MGPAPAAPQLLRSSKATPPPPPPPCTVDAAREIFITDASVVDDCYRTSWTGDCPGTLLPATRGAWTFGRVAEGIFGTTDPKRLSNRVRQWLNQWMETQIVNGDTVPARPAMRDLVLRPWEEASGKHGNQLDMTKAPFRLLAFALRMDIRNGVLDPRITTAGEFHVVYNLLDQDGQPTDFNVVFEYVLEARNCQEILAWAQRFHGLGSVPFGPEYNAALQAVTDHIMTPGAAPDRLNGSALVAVRTNENFLDSPWEMREFILARDDDEEDGGTRNAKLVHSFLELTPAVRYQGTQTLADYVNLATPDIESGNQQVPVFFRGQPFLAGVAPNRLDLNWDGPAPACSSIHNSDARRLFSIFTCQGCHGPETGTVFRHVFPRQPGAASELSPYMTGIVVTDFCGITFGFNDVRRRRNDFCFLLTRVCPTP